MKTLSKIVFFLINYLHISLLTKQLKGMKKDNKLVGIFGSTDDPGSHVNQLHKLNGTLLIGMVSVVCGAETQKQMVGFANSKVGFLKEFLELPNGILSEDTINRLFSSIDSSQFESCFIDWVNSISNISKGQVIAIDGK
ncbi:MAG: ISAs1 family transposase, partial [Bacteroidales bacterium]|nr:ISAs1 family transposase [Bacteroidales bacterium]